MKFGQGLPPADGWKRDMPEPKVEHTHGPFAGPYSSCPACSAASKRKPLPPHWYLIYVRECPVCMNTKIERIRQFTPRPKDALNRVEYVPTYDWCQG